MKVLVVCITYGRLPFLGRMVASFLNQNYDDKELLIINDDRNVQLTCHHNNYDESIIHIINLNKRLSLGAKRNLGSAFGNYDLYMPHDDDDIFLPDRISNHVAKHKENPDISLYWNSASYTIYGDNFSVDGNSVTAISYKQPAWFECGGYADMGSGEDQDFYNRMQNKLIERDLSKVDYVYNWGGINYHATFSSIEDIGNIAESQLRDFGVYGSKYDITPDWYEYDKFCLLDRLYKQGRRDLLVKHTGLTKIDVSHLEANV